MPKTWFVGACQFRSFVRRHLPRGCWPDRLLGLAEGPRRMERAASARAAILSAPMDPALRAALEELWDQTRDQAPWGMAVRSSGTCEDSPTTAMAGLAESVLGVRGADQLVDALRRVWSSLLFGSTLDHLARAGIRDAAMAVVIQPVVVAEASGVLFTHPPPGTDPGVWGEDERLVNATLGLGSPVVEGAMAPDVARLRRCDGRVLSRIVVPKRRALVVGDDGPTWVDVPPERAAGPALSREAMRELVGIADHVERHAKEPQDVEFVVAERGVVIVQTRATPGGGFPEGGDERTVWSRANVGEALPGAATPLTWSVARDFSERGFHRAFGALGCAVPPGASLVACVHGRFYLNLTQFMAIASQVPGLHPRTWLEVGGGRGAELLEGASRRATPWRFWCRLPRTVSQLVAEQTRLRHRFRRFDAAMRRERAARKRQRLSVLSLVGLAAAWREVLAALDRAGTLMLSCASASLAAHLALKAVLEWREPGRGDELTQVLVAGTTVLESARPGIAIAQLAEMARRRSDLARVLAQGTVSGVDDLLDGDLRRLLQAFMEEFGDRAIREAELATPRWREQPDDVWAMVATAIRAPAAVAEASLARTRARADRCLAEIAGSAPPGYAWPLTALVRHARSTTELREATRAWVTRSLSDIRQVALEVDRRMVAADAALTPGAVFFCTSAELTAALGSARLPSSHVVRLRRAEHGRDAARPDPPVTFVGRPPVAQLPPPPGEVLAGLPASGGVVEGPVRVMCDGRPPRQLAPGEILVARTTDVGLTPLFLVAAGVVTELGGPLSHAAIVAREYGVPAVVNVPGATLALRDGQRVRVDGHRGVVYRLPGADHES